MMDPINTTPQSISQPSLNNPSKQNTKSNIGSAPHNVSQSAHLPKTSLAGMYSAAKGSTGRAFDFQFSSLVNYLAIIVALTITVVLVLFVIRPQYNVYVENQTRVVETKAALDKVKAHFTYLENLRNLRTELTTNIELSTEAVPQEEDVPQFLNQITKISEETDLEVQKHTFRGVQNQVQSADGTDIINAGEIKTNTSVVGTYENLISMMKILENARRIVSLDSIKISEINQNVQRINPPSTSTTTDDVSGVELNSSIFSDTPFNIDVTLVGYHLTDPNIEQLTIDQLVSKNAQPEALLKQLSEMSYYPLEEVDLEFGRDNPFEESGIEPAEAVIEETTQQITEPDDQQPVNSGGLFPL